MRSFSNVKYNSDTLKKDTDYTVSYSNNINVGIATVTVTGKGDYEKTVELKYTIKEAAPEFGWYNAEGKAFWYENRTRQGTYDKGMGECVLNAIKSKAGKWVHLYSKNFQHG